MNAQDTSAQTGDELHPEIAHLLLIDVVGFSKLSDNDQIEVLQELNQVVRNTECFRAAEAAGSFMRLPTGDGMTLVFFHSPEEPVRCALEISKALQEHSRIQLRMGVHSGQVNRVTDINDKTGLTGSGINIAQRVLDCGDAGHILLSAHIAEDLVQYRHWQPYLHDLGECEVKHGLRLHLFNLYKDGLGDPQVPSRLKRRGRKKESNAVRPISAPQRPKVLIAVALAVAVLALVISSLIFFHRASSTPTSVSPKSDAKATPIASGFPEKSIAVLPFENLSDEKANAYFADGVQDEILTYLAKIADLKTISRISVIQYKSDAARNLPEISQQLGVAHVVEGSVQRSDGRVRVNARLVDARINRQIWGETYDRDLADVFAIQSEIAKTISDQLHAKLSPDEKTAIEERPTADLVAFDQYSRAKTLILTSSFSLSLEKNYLEAIDLLNSAIARDPAFYAPYFELVFAHDSLYALGTGEHTAARLALAEAALQGAVKLRPDSGETHLARAWHLYFALRDYDGAMAEVEAARRSLANDPRVFALSGYILRRQGRHEEGLRDLEHAVQLDPRNTYTLTQVANSYGFLRRYPEKRAVLDRVVTINPDDVEAQCQRALVDLYWKGDTQPLHQVIENLRVGRPVLLADVADIWLLCALAERDWSAAERALAALGSNPFWTDNAIKMSAQFGEGLLARAMHDEARAHKAFTAARLEQEEAVQKQKDYGPALCVLSLIDAALGNNEAALQEGERAMELLPEAKDSLNGQALVAYFALIAAWAGEKDPALEHLERAVPTPGATFITSYGLLKLHPFWDPLRGDPRFEKIVASLAPK